MNSRVVYRQQLTRCGKQRCRKCKEGEGHGPYWYAYWNENGRTKTKYIGVRLPPELAAAQSGFIEGEDVPAEAAPALRIYLLGQFRIERRDGREWHPVDGQVWQHRRTRSLLGCLLSNPGRRLGREQVMKLLWPDLEREIASNRLNGAVHELRHILEPGITRVATSNMLRLEHDTLELAGRDRLWVDAEAFEQLLHQAETAIDVQEAERLLLEAEALYRGSYLLEELYSEWAAARRDTLQQERSNLLLKLANLRAARGAAHEAIEALDRLRAADPTNETALRWLMVYLTQLHRRGEALSIYRQHAKMLKREYEGEPLPETRSLYTMLRQGRIADEYLLPTNKVAPFTSMAIRSASAPATAEPPAPPFPSEKITFVRPAWQPQHQHLHPLLGRNQELEDLRHLLASFDSPVTMSQHLHFLLLTGQAGVGKTRLVEELGLEAYRLGWAVVQSKASEIEQPLPYQPWITSLHTLLPDLSSSPFIQQQERSHLWEAIRESFFTICQAYPLLLILDDLQWADADSINLLGYLLHHLQEQRILLAATCRDGEFAATPALSALLTELQRKHLLARLPIQSLAETEIAALVAHLPQHIAQRIQAMAAGNPLFAEELAQQAEQRSSPSQSMHTLPTAINTLFERHLSTISGPCRSLLRQAAQLGEAFELNQLLLLAQGQTEDTILDLLDEALRAKLLREVDTGGYITYHFWHPLLVRHLL